ncbi:MAG: hypothetical protein HY561_10610 [Gemmatimonadetes bacterium]|nr:hypothetical protein [Gemmatimonadota bacterium]
MKTATLPFLFLVGACTGRAPAPEPLPPLPDPSGWGTHVLVEARAPDGAVWVGSYGAGI